MNPLISLHHVSFSYPGGHPVLNHITVEIPAGKKIALLGRNGVGKSTLLSLLNGLLRPVSGELCYQGKPYGYNKRSLAELRKNVGLLFGDPDAQLIAPSVYEEISFGLMNLSNDKEWVRMRTDEAIEEFNLQELATQPPHQLSDGQKKRVTLAAIIAMEPTLLIADEPAASLDPHYASLVFEKMDALNKAGKTILYSSHDVDQVYAWADHVIVLHEGKIMACGSPSTVFDQPEWIRACNLKVPVVHDLARLFSLSDDNIHTLEELKHALREAGKV